MNCRFLPVDQRHLREAWSIREDPVFEVAPELGDQFNTLDASAVRLAALACERLGLDSVSIDIDAKCCEYMLRRKTCSSAT